jgi:hypothetical protein
MAEERAKNRLTQRIRGWLGSLGHCPRRRQSGQGLAESAGKVGNLISSVNGTRQESDKYLISGLSVEDPSEKVLGPLLVFRRDSRVPL